MVLLYINILSGEGVFCHIFQGQMVSFYNLEWCDQNGELDQITRFDYMSLNDLTNTKFGGNSQTSNF